ncbi:MAG: hypothetical protein LIO46_02085 [Clostridiales bacterium]|nr:hypothetical protein [Clostridiales bacterium]
MDPIGLYVHIPFCTQKCPYCDFYSLPAAQGRIQAYTETAARQISTLRPPRPADTR